MSSTTDPTATIIFTNDPEDLKLFDNSTRIPFLWLFIIVTIFAFFGNCAAIYSISKRNYRIFQKTCIISLALSDILGTVAIAIINITNLAEEIMTWPLGSFLCKFLPMGQMAGVLASSIALMFIAMDRYRNVVYALSKGWNPRLSFCLVATLMIWVASFAVSSPIYTFFKILHYPVNGTTLPCCIMVAKKENFRNYYITMVVIIFCPLFFVFLWFYYSIASLVWKHRKPLSTIFNKKAPQENSSSTCELKNLPKTQDDIRVERKIRTFKIIIALMVVFIFCRLPYFAVQILKYVDSEFADRPELWYMSFSFMALHIVNCFLNPLLYTFLNLTLKVWAKIEAFILEVCCFCCSKAEFESFEKENPFANIEPYDKRNSKVRFEDEKKY